MNPMIREILTRLINSLTKSEDYRQDLWVHYLEGNSQFDLKDHLKELKKIDRQRVEAEQTYIHIID